MFLKSWILNQFVLNIFHFCHISEKNNQQPEHMWYRLVPWICAPNLRSKLLNMTFRRPLNAAKWLFQGISTYSDDFRIFHFLPIVIGKTMLKGHFFFYFFDEQLTPATCIHSSQWLKLTLWPFWHRNHGWPWPNKRLEIAWNDTRRYQERHSFRFSILLFVQCCAFERQSHPAETSRNWPFYPTCDVIGDLAIHFSCLSNSLCAGLSNAVWILRIGP